MRLPSAYALTATLAFGSVASAQVTDAKIVGTWSTKSNKTLTGPVRYISSLRFVACSLTITEGLL